jgi:hypothetical protein
MSLYDCRKCGKINVPFDHNCVDDDAWLKQFEKSRKNVAEWPKWMRDLAYTAAATLPSRCKEPK